MNLPLETQQLCEKYLEKVWQDPEHQLTERDRATIFGSWGIELIAINPYPRNLANFSQADFAMGWLAVITAEKVAFICQQKAKRPEFSEYEEVDKLLGTAIDFLGGRLNYEDAKNVLMDFWFFYRPDLKYDVLCAWRSAMSALNFILHEEAFPDFLGFVVQAVTAFSVIDHNLPGKADRSNPPIPLEYDLTKRLEFWEWWLTEAIPQAWDLANRTYTKQRP
jgi:hypothetical protein